MSFKINYEDLSEYTLPELTTELIGYFSIDSDFRYQADLSQMKYYSPPTNPDDVNYDLTVNPTSISNRTNTYLKLDYVLKWILDNFNQLKRPLSSHQERWLNVDFICRRGLLKRLLCSPYATMNTNEWIICASKYRDTIYLCDYYTDEKEEKVSNDTIKNKQITFSGYKFEQYMVTDHPLYEPNISASLNEYTQFHCMFKTSFGGHSLLYSAEIDGIYSQQPIKDTIIGKTVELIELKTTQIYKGNSNLYGKLNAYKAICWWSQNYLVKIDKIICGLKEGMIVKRIKEYPTHLIPKLSKVDCEVDKCKMFCKLFLDYVKKIVAKDHKDCMYKFYWSPSTKIVHYSEITPDDEKYSFLSSWFIEEAEKYKSTLQAT